MHDLRAEAGAVLSCKLAVEGPSPNSTLNAAHILEQTRLDSTTHEELVEFIDESTVLHALLAIHSTALGPAFGSCRLWQYCSRAEALYDVLS